MTKIQPKPLLALILRNFSVWVGVGECSDQCKSSGAAGPRVQGQAEAETGWGCMVCAVWLVTPYKAGYSG